MSAVLAIARVNVVRMLRDRTGLFFVFLLPVILIMVLGFVYGGRDAPRLGVVMLDDGPLSGQLLEAIAAGEMRFERVDKPSPEELSDAVEAGTLEVGLLVPAGYDADLRDGGAPTVEVLGKQQTALSALREGVAAAIASQAARVRAVRLVMAEAGVAFDQALATVDRVAAAVPPLDVAVTTVGTAAFPEDAGSFTLGAQSQLVLFMFLTSMTAATQLILSRQLGVTRRMLSTPTPVRGILMGELLGRFLVAMIQGVFIVLVSSILFGVAWGNLAGATALVVCFALVGTGAAMVVGAFGSNPDQASSLGVFLGMALGALGGAMVPLELFGEPLATLAYLTPQAWAIEGFRDLAFRGADVVAILRQLGVLLAYAAVLVGLGTWGLRRALTRG